MQWLLMHLNSRRLQKKSKNEPLGRADSLVVLFCFSLYFNIFLSAVLFCGFPLKKHMFTVFKNLFPNGSDIL